MASIGHLAVGMAASRLSPPPDRRRLARAMMLLAALAMLPDADVIGGAFGVPYGAPWGHRGATHSFAFALVVGAVVAAAGPWAGAPARTFLVATLVVASHPVLDMLTDGGRGCAVFWPLDDTRYFLPWRPLPVAPIGLGFLSARGLKVSLVELVAFAPLFAFALWPRRTAASAAPSTTSTLEER
ncbi:MAG: metal-dependent hydrolase [Vicinamibacterales bacterium]